MQSIKIEPYVIQTIANELQGKDILSQAGDMSEDIKVLFSSLEIDMESIKENTKINKKATKR